MYSAFLPSGPGVNRLFMSAKTRRWQDEVSRMAKDANLDVLRIGVDEQQTAIALSEFIAERRLRKAA